MKLKGIPNRVDLKNSQPQDEDLDSFKVTKEARSRVVFMVSWDHTILILFSFIMW